MSNKSPRNTSKRTQEDLIDTLRQDWKKEAPTLDTSAMEVVGRITRIATRWDQDIELALQEFGLSYTDFDILATLKRSGTPYELLPTQLCNAILLTSGAMTSALGRLEKRDLIARRVSREDRRQKFVRLLPAGVKLAQKAGKVRFAVAREQTQPLSKRDFTALSALLRELSLSLEAD